MIFKLFTDNGVWLYDNIGNSFYDHDGIRRCGNNGFPENVGEKIKQKVSVQDIHNITIKLGNKCNFHCKYCIQNKLDRKRLFSEDFGEENIEKIISFLRKFNLHGIGFFGGEPLVYWKSLKKIIIKIRSDESFKNTCLDIITNGSLLTKDKVEFLLKHKVYIVISYDGKNSDRDYDIFEDENVVDSIKYALSLDYNLIQLMPTQSNNCDSYETIKNNLERKLGKIKINYRGIVKSSCDEVSPENKKILWIKKESKLNELENEIYNRLKKRLPDKNITYFERNFGRLIKNFQHSNFSTICLYAISARVCIDMNGNIYACGNNDSIIGTINNFENMNKEIYKYYMEFEKCRKCVLCRFCNGGGCPLIKDENSEGFKINCRNNGSVAMGKFKAFLKREFGICLERIENETN